MGVVPPEADVSKLVERLINASLEAGMVETEDVVTIVHGFLPGVSGTTNTVQVLDIKEYLARTPATDDTEVVGRW